LHAPQISSAADASEIQPDTTTSIEAAKAMKRIMRVILEKTSPLDQPGRMDFSPGIERGQPQKGTRNHKRFLCLVVPFCGQSESVRLAAP
jgi:hypothetical protein